MTESAKSLHTHNAYLNHLTRDQLANHPPANAVSRALDAWAAMAHSRTATKNHEVGLFLDILADRGHAVVPADQKKPRLADGLVPAVGVVAGLAVVATYNVLNTGLVGISIGTFAMIYGLMAWQLTRK